MKTRIVIFGAGKGGERAFSLLKKKYSIIAFSDNNPSIHGTKFRSIPIVSPEKIKDLNPERIYIASQHSMEIYLQLNCDMGWDSNRLEIVNSEVLIHHSWIPRPRVVLLSLCGLILFLTLLKLGEML